MSQEASIVHWTDSPEGDRANGNLGQLVEDVLVGDGPTIVHWTD